METQCRKERIKTKYSNKTKTWLKEIKQNKTKHESLKNKSMNNLEKTKRNKNTVLIGELSLVRIYSNKIKIKQTLNDVVRGKNN